MRGEELFGGLCEIVGRSHDGGHLGQVAEKENVLAPERLIIVRRKGLSGEPAKCHVEAGENGARDHCGFVNDQK